MRFYFMKTSKAQMQFCSVGKSTIEARVVSDIVIQSALSKMDTFGTGTKCPSQRGVRLIKIYWCVCLYSVCIARILTSPFICLVRLVFAGGCNQTHSLSETCQWSQPLAMHIGSRPGSFSFDNGDGSENVTFELNSALFRTLSRLF